MPRSLPSSHPAAAGRRDGGRGAFTVVELLVVAAILALLMGIVLPALTQARYESRRGATRSDIQALSAAVDRYKAEWGEYPRCDGDNPPQPPAHGPGPMGYRTGGELLVDFLCGPDDAYRLIGDPSVDELRFAWLADPASPEPAKLLARSGLKKINVPGVTSFGRTIGPYVQYSPERVRAITASGVERMFFVDSWGGPILYWRAVRGDLATADVYTIFPLDDNLPVLDDASFKGVDNDDWKTTSDLWQNYLQTETGATEGSIPDRDRFLLISPGRNGKFGWPSLAADLLRTNDPRLNDDILSCRIDEG